MSSGYHPQSNGQTEHLNQVLDTSIHCLAPEVNNLSGQKCPQLLPLALLWFFTFFHCVYSYQPPLFPALKKEAKVRSTLALVHLCCHTWDIARCSLPRHSDQYKVAADRGRSKGPTYQKGQRVWLSTKNLPLCVEARKLPIFKVINPVASNLRLPRTMRAHPMFHISHVITSRESALVPDPPPLCRRRSCLHCPQAFGCSPTGTWVRKGGL